MAGKKFVHGLCDCTYSYKNCLFGVFCAPCLAGCTAEKLSSRPLRVDSTPGRDWKVTKFALLSCFLPCVAMYKLRDKARRRTGEANPDEVNHGVGDKCRHCLASIFCAPCVNCQVRFVDYNLS